MTAHGASIVADPKSQTKSQRPQTPGHVRPLPATIAAARWHVKLLPAPSSHATDFAYKRGGAGSNPAAPARFLQLVEPLREPLGDIKLRGLTAEDVQQTLDALADRLSTRTLQILRNCLERAIRHAEIRDLVGRNMAAVVKPPGER
jgi:hypothetical protein